VFPPFFDEFIYVKFHKKYIYRKMQPLIVLLVLVCIVIVAEGKKRPSPCPAFFLIIPLDLYSRADPVHMGIADYGSYFLTNGTQFPPPFYVPKDTVMRLTDVYHCAITNVLVSDNPIQLESRIREWIEYQCKLLGKEPSDCYRPKFSENVVTSIIPLERNNTELPPTYSPTIRALASPKCENRPDETTCRTANPGNKECHWFGVIHGCKDFDFCGGLSQVGCGERTKYCRWRGFNLGCVSRSS
jgi:hypothetical protein